MQTIEGQALAKLETKPSTAQIEAWVELASKKNEIAQVLTNAELELQQILLKCDVKDYKAIDAALAEYRKKQTEMVETRKSFTSIIDANIVQPLMAFEKRVDTKTNAKYAELGNISLTLRQIAESEARKLQELQNEVGRFLGHCTNEFLRIETKYIHDLNTEVDAQYAYNLNAGVKQPMFAEIEAYLRGVKLDAIRKFDFVLLSKEKMQELFATVPQPNYNHILQNKIDMLEQIFINYSSDLANVAATIERRELDAKIAAKEAEEKLIAESSINNLIASATVEQVEVPKIKTELIIEPINSPEWATLIMTQFISNLPTLFKLVRVKAWENLSIGQMAAAIAKHATDTGETYKGIIYKELKK
jgi:hypothetical protein